MRERSFLQSVFALDLRHLLIAGFLVLAIIAGSLIGARHLPVKYSASALLSIDPPPSASASASRSPALATADEILRSDQFAALGSRLHLFPAQSQAPAHFRSQITLTQAAPATLRLTLTGTDPRATTTAANAIASLLAAWVPIDAPSSPLPSVAPVPATPPTPPRIGQPTPPSPASALPVTETSDLDQSRHDLAARQDALELQFDRTNRKLATLSAKLQKLDQNLPSSAASIASIEKQQASLHAWRARQLRQLEANDSASDVLRARAAAVRRAGAVASAPAMVKAPPTPAPISPATPAPQLPAPASEAARISFSVAAWAHNAQPIPARQKGLLTGLGLASGGLCGLLYLIFAVRFYRPVTGASDLEEILPEETVFLGAIPAPSVSLRSTP